MKKTNETQLKESIASLRDYMSVVAPTQVQEGEWGTAIGKGLGGAAGAIGGTMAGGPLGGIAGGALGYGAGGAAGNAVGDWVSNAANKVGDVASGAWKGAQAAYNAPTTGAAPAQAAAPAGTTKPTGKSDPAVMKIQQDLIAKGAKIKADGIMGPATQAAQKQFSAAPILPAVPGATPGMGAKGPTVAAAAGLDPSNPLNKAAAAAPAAPAAAAPAAPAAAAPAAAAPAADGGPAPTPEQLKWLGGADPTDKFILARMRSAVPNAVAPVAKPALTPQQQAQNVLQPGSVKESIGFRNDDSLARILSITGRVLR